MCNETVAAISEAIHSGVESIDEVREIQLALKLKIDELNRRARLKFHVGSKAKFYSPKMGRYVEGTIRKVNPQSVKLVTEIGSTWKVSSSLLEECDS